MPQAISFEEFEAEIERIANDMLAFVAEKNRIKRAVGRQCADFWVQQLQDLIEDTKKD